MKHLSFCCTVIILLGTFCKSKPNLSPEETAQQWQAYIDKNQFDRARELSVGEALDYVDELAGYNTTSDTLAWEDNIMLNLKCQIIGSDSAICSYHFEDELGAPAPGHLGLRRVKGYWFVSRTNFDDVPDDRLRRGDEDLHFPTDSLDEELE